MKIYKLYFPILTFLVVAVLCSLNNIWAYDESAAVISHLELDDHRFIDKYRIYLNEIITNIHLQNFIIEYLLPFFIVPIRWTYALGISPIYGISRFLSFDWVILRLIFTTIHIVFNAFGLYLILKTLNIQFYSKKNISFLFIGLLFFSFPFIYWLLSLTSYSFHLLCFGLLIYTYCFFNKSQLFFSFKSFAYSLIILLNYQYVPVLFVLGLYELLLNWRVFFKEKLYKSWIFPSCLSSLSLIYLFIRSSVFSIHSNPSRFTLDDDILSQYIFSSNLSEFSEFLMFPINRFYDIINYFFINENYNEIFFTKIYSEIPIYLIIFCLIIALFFYFKFNYEKSKIMQIVFIVLFTNILLYLIGVYPLIPSRHSLIMFLPFITFISYFFIFHCHKFISNNLTILIIIIFSFLNLYNNYTISSNLLDKDYLINTLNESEIDIIVLNSCSFEPLLYLNDHKTFYKCGPSIIEMIDNSKFESKRIAFYSSSTFNSKLILKELSLYFNNIHLYSFELIKEFTQHNIKEEKHFIWIFECKRK